MNQSEDRIIVRDSYNCKIFEIIRRNERIFIYDFGSGWIFGREESQEVLKGLEEFQLKWRIEP